ncbi:MAG: GGDEF domain-containing protein [Methylococcaceae bacterium]|jgi:diguanylate cyclase (GGDEF)-like protein/putative nucleotidyltransferase with HDIG domain
MTTAEMDTIAEIKMAASSILKQDIGHLQLVPSVAIKLLKLTNDSKTQLNDLSKIIETEPALAAKVLKIVNSAIYCLPHKITSIKRAVNFLGFSAVRRAALDLLFYNQFINYRSTQAFNTLFFWQHCLFVAALSRNIANSLGHQDPDLVYTAGLLHDIGKIVLETSGQLTYSDFINSIGAAGKASPEEEQRFFGITHTEIGHVFCLTWKLPASITAVVSSHHTTPSLSFYSAYKTEIAIVAFANYIAWIQGLGSVSEQAYTHLDGDVLNLIDINSLNLDNLLQLVDQEMQTTQEFYGIEFPSLGKLRATLVKTSISLSLVGSNDQPQQTSVLGFSEKLTIPHRSLNPDDFVPWTLAAIQQEYALDRLVLLNIDPKHRSFYPAYHWPNDLQVPDLKAYYINIDSLTGSLLNCLREKKPGHIQNKNETDKKLLQHFNSPEFIITPVLQQERLIGLIYGDNWLSKKPLLLRQAQEILPLAAELGIALSNAKLYNLEKQRAQYDPLTQIYNRRMIDDFLTKLFRQPESQRIHTAIGFIDIDKFKIFNDLCGHQAGDDVLKIVADTIRCLTRPGDFVGRYGGEEFLFILNKTEKNGAAHFAERIRLEIERRGNIMKPRFKNQGLTVSLGVALYHPKYRSPEEFVEVADQAMYQAKNKGRNRVIILDGENN